MARQVNSNYQMFKRNLQRRFVDRYKHNESIQYTEQDREHLKLIKPEIPEPIINNRIEKRFGKRIGRGGGAKKPVFNNDAFEREYLEFINMLKANKAKAEQAPAEVQVFNSISEIPKLSGINVQYASCVVSAYVKSSI